MNFQKIVLSVAAVLFVISVIMIIVAITNGKSKQSFPPVLGECPDYWKDMTKGKGGDVNYQGTKCVNVHNLGVCSDAPDFSQTKYVGNNGLCEKSNWANSCNLTWDGITNNPNICSDID